ncbi:pilus assembly protein TadE [Ruegeria marisrubri]|uniref:Pilus assembly protein TadE n=1 Tax=Ruegeria marisrubri TaxID=1685379 RepID=A0A0X3TXW7_9RHOB|nr:TadE/TadG family type IV pilus assembly protein [Ruegeria marisrubri]KUJ80565.1 pilus assembly protein TadE [Ruegeria marisrubri]
MIKGLISNLQRFRRRENGTATIEFVIVFPAFMFLVLSGVELALMTLKHAQLERAVDLTVRDIRLNTGANMQHDDIKRFICDRATFISDCSANMRLEMVRQDPFAQVTIPAEPDCTDLSEEVRPVRAFHNGQENELMVLRACAKINPVFPTSAMGKALANAEGQYALTATTVFVQEPI